MIGNDKNKPQTRDRFQGNSENKNKMSSWTTLGYISRDEIRLLLLNEFELAYLLQFKQWKNPCYFTRACYIETWNSR